MKLNTIFHVKISFEKENTQYIFSKIEREKIKTKRKMNNTDEFPLTCESAPILLQFRRARENFECCRQQTQQETSKHVL